ncbi:MAG: serine/threonine-protein kinase [Myxococcota bacterium]
MTDELIGLPDVIGRYEVRGLLGRGGMGRVVRGHDPKLRRDVALKLVEPLVVDPEDMDELRFMFHREARATAALRHPSVVEVYDYSGPDAELMYIACELIDAPTIDRAMEDRGAPLTARVAAAIGYELSGALQAAHELDIIHRDVKPDNVFWSHTGRLILSDFGIAKALGQHNAQLGATVQFGKTNLYGSPAYMAPEQLNEGDVGVRTDLYALGILIFECVTGAHAFQGEDIRQLVDNVLAGRRTLSVIPHGIPASLTRLLEELMEVDPARRPASAADAKARFRSVLDELEVGDPRPWLADFGSLDDADTETDDDPEADVETVFYSEASRTIRVPRPRAKPSRAPFVFAMVTVAVGLGLGMTLISQLSSFPGVGNIFKDNSGAMDQPEEDIFIRLRFPGRARITVDGFDMGEWENSVRFAMTEGTHQVTIEADVGVLNREVILISGTTPEFVFQAEDFSPKPPESP